MLGFTIDFAWERPAKAKGFAWQEMPNGATQLVRVEGAPFESYKPLEEQTGLFRTFAALAPEPKPILHFANRFGALGSGWDDDLPLWNEAIGRAKCLVTVYDALVSANWPSLRTVLGRLPPALFQPGVDVEKASPGELVGAAVHLLYNDVGGMTLGWTFGVWSKGQRPPVVWNPSKKEALLKLTPPSLWHAICFQFGQAILGNKSYQQCKACGRWFELAPGVNIASRQTCSDYCRVKSYRGRQKKARELRGEGLSLKKISAEIGSDVPTVKKWLQE